MRKTWVAVADGRKALLFVNDGADLKPKLRVLSVEEVENPPSREQGHDAPGRMNDGRAGGVRKSAFEATDYHDLEEERFAAKFVAMLDRAAVRSEYDKLVLIAPPGQLGALRAAMTPQVRARVSLELDRDLVNHPVREIEQHLADAFDKR